MTVKLKLQDNTPVSLPTLNTVLKLKWDMVKDIQDNNEYIQLLSIYVDTVKTDDINELYCIFSQALQMFGNIYINELALLLELIFDDEDIQAKYRVTRNPLVSQDADADTIATVLAQIKLVDWAK